MHKFTSQNYISKQVEEKLGVLQKVVEQAKGISLKVVK